MPRDLVDAASSQAFLTAIAEIENVSAVEVVVSVRRQSASYLHANFLMALVTAFVMLWFALYSQVVFSLNSILFGSFVVAAIAAGLVEVIAPIKRWLSPRSMRYRAVQLAARAEFYQRGVGNTARRTGVLVYVSWLERIVVLVADGRIREVVQLDELAAIEVAAGRNIDNGGAAVAAVIAKMAILLGERLPKQDNDQNELPDVVDINITRRARDSEQQ